MTMGDWATRLDRILTMGGERLLKSAGEVSHEQAVDKAENEYKKYQMRTFSEVEKAYLESLKTAQKAIESKSEEQGD